MSTFIKHFEKQRESIEYEYRNQYQTRRMALESHDSRLVDELNSQISDAGLQELIAKYHDESDEYVASHACDAVVSRYELSQSTRDMLDQDLHRYVATRVAALRDSASYL